MLAFGKFLRFWQPEPGGRPALGLLPSAAFYLAVFGAAVAWQSQRHGGAAALWRPPREQWLPWWAAAVAVSWILVLGPALLEDRVPALRQLGADLYEAVAPITRRRVAVLALLSGFAEELLFRGPLQATLGWPVAAVLFAALHGGGARRLWPWTAFALVAGGLFGALVDAYDSLSPAIVAHVTVNAINMQRLTRFAPQAGRPRRLP